MRTRLTLDEIIALLRAGEYALGHGEGKDAETLRSAVRKLSEGTLAAALRPAPCAGPNH
jgi:hypothetical protein